MPDADTPPVEVPPILDASPLRAPWAWVLLASVFIFLIFGQLAVRKPTEPTSAFDESESVLRFKSLMIAKHGSGATPDTPSILPVLSTDASLKQLRAGLSSDDTKDVNAAKLALAIDYELQVPPNPRIVGYLHNSESLADQEFAEVYSNETLSSTWVEKVKPRFPQNFLGRVVLSHAEFKAGDQLALGRMVGRTDQLSMVLIAVCGLGIVLVGLAVIVSLVVASTNGQLKPVGHPLKGLTPADADRLALRMSVFMLLLVLVPSLVALVLDNVLRKEVAYVIGEVVLLVATVFFLKLKVFGKSDSFRRLMGRTSKWPTLVVYGALGFAGSAPVTLFLALVTQLIFKDAPRPTHPISEQISVGASPLALAMMFVLAVVMAPILEEISFRGILFPALSRYLGPVGSILLSGFMFGAIHPQGPVLWAALAGIGSMSALLAYLTGSLIPSMVMHACHNATLLIITIVLLY